MTTPLNFTIDTDKAPASTAPRKRGRPPGSTNAAKSTQTEAATLAQALATMDSLYTFTATGLAMFGFIDTATVWIDTADKLRETNKDALKASPRLAKAIANAGSVGGGTTFAVTHIMAISTLIQGVSAELKARREADAKGSPDNVTELHPGA